MKRYTEREWDSLVEGMLAVLPLSQDYEIRFERKSFPPGSEIEGWCECLDVESAKFVIGVSKDVSLSHATEILIHELAHLLDWKPYTPWTANHGATFWIYYGEIYRAYHQVM